MTDRVREYGTVLDGYTSPTTDAGETKKLAFSRVPASTAAAREFAFSGIVIGLSNATDKGGALLVAIQEPSRFLRLEPGHVLPPARKPFSRIFLKRAPETSSSASKFFHLDVSDDRGFSYGSTPPRILEAGCSSVPQDLLDFVTGVPQLIIAANTTRRFARIGNETAGYLWLATTSPADHTTCFERIAPGDKSDVPLVTDIYGITDVDGPVRVGDFTS